MLRATETHALTSCLQQSSGMGNHCEPVLVECWENVHPPQIT